MSWNSKIKRRLKLKDLDVLMAVVQAGGMGKAAHRLNLSQPAVSKAVADLEETLGVRLLDRSRQGVVPTPYGLALIKRCTTVFDELRQGIQDVEYLADPTRGELRIGVTEPIAGSIIAPVLDRLSRQYPRMSFSVAVDDGTRLRSDLAQRKYELVIVRTTGPVSDGELSELLFHDMLVVVAAAGNQLTRRRRVLLADLVDKPWTLWPFDTHFGALAAEVFRSNGLELPRLTISTASVNLINTLLATGRFLTILPSFLLSLPCKHPLFSALPIALPNTRHPIQIITLKNRTLSPLARLFIDRVREITKPLAAGQQGV
jgi:DNA-binding transcriptional LysR family regulator